MDVKQRRYNASHYVADRILAISAPIVGLSSVERIKEVVEAVNLELTEDEIKNLEEPYSPRSISGHS
jgi:aryl-alcohol dehydrogenase-like predicted oxidoreductase